jgi:hypothetical protein
MDFHEILCGGYAVTLHVSEMLVQLAAQHSWLVLVTLLSSRLLVLSNP